MNDSYANYRNQIISNIRERSNHERKLKRDIIINRRRGVIGNLVHGSQVFQPYEVNEIADKLLNKKGDINDIDIGNLAMAFIQSNKNICVFVFKRGAIHALVREMTGVNSYLRLLATECVVNLTLGDADCCFKVAKLAAPYLITNLQATCSSLKIATLWATGNLVGSDLKTWNLFQSQGVLPLLIQSVAMSELEEIGSYALMHYVNIGFHELSLEDLKEISIAMIKVQRYTADAAWLLYLLTCRDCYDCDLSLKFINICFDALQKNNIEYGNRMVIAKIRILANSVMELSGCCADYVINRLDILFAEVMDAMESHFIGPSSSYLVRELCWLVGNLLKHPSEIVQQRMKMCNEIVNELETQFKSLGNR